MKRATGELAMVLGNAAAFGVCDGVLHAKAPAIAATGLFWLGYIVRRCRGEPGVWRTWGFGTSGLWPASGASAAAILAGSAGMLGYGLIHGHVNVPPSFWLLGLLYLPWGLMQQFLVNAMFAANMKQLLAERGLGVRPHTLMTVVVTALLSPETKTRIEQYLSKVVPGLEAADVKGFGPKETIEFRQRVGANLHPWRFLAASMSDGTLRALGNLVALFQFANGRQSVGSLVGIEEPETGLHPAAAGVLRDGLRDASERTQVIVTSHSPDLLDDASISEEEVLAVSAEAGMTRIGPLDAVGRSALRDRLYTAGELLRLNQLNPDPEPPAELGDDRAELVTPTVGP